MKNEMAAGSRRAFMTSSVLALATPLLGTPKLVAESLAGPAVAGTPLDAERMRSLIAFTMLTMGSPHPVPYGAEIFDAITGTSLMRAVNAVGQEHDPSAHGEVHTIRLACAKIKSARLTGHTLYTTVEPCPMCMACCLWAGLDRVVYGATIADAAKYGSQIMIPSAEVARRTDMHCEVVGPVERELALELYTNEKMQAFRKRWK